MPTKVVSPLEGLRNNAPAGTTIEFEFGPESDDQIVFFNGEQTRLPGTDTPGLQLEFFDGDGSLLRSETRTSGRLVLMDIGLAMRTKRVVYTTDFIPEFTGTHRIGMATAGKVEYGIVGGETFAGDIQLLSGDFAEYILNPPDVKSKVELTAGERVPLRFTFFPEDLKIPTLSLGVGYRVPVKPDNDALSTSAKLAEASDISIVFVGTSSAIESEGWDRKNLRLPDGQDELVETVATASKKTIVVINAGSPVEMPWFEK
jgi:beta-glucosidase